MMVKMIMTVVKMMVKMMITVVKMVIVKALMTVVKMMVAKITGVKMIEVTRKMMTRMMRTTTMSEGTKTDMQLHAAETVTERVGAHKESRVGQKRREARREEGKEGERKRKRIET
eukprot:2624491-Rhodomonas_salina.2